MTVDLGATAGEEAKHVVIDSTGLKIFGEGEWKVRQHGYSKRRTWRKLHIGVNAETQQIEAVVLSEAGLDDAEAGKVILEQTPATLNRRVLTVPMTSANSTKLPHSAVLSVSQCRPARTPKFGSMAILNSRLCRVTKTSVLSAELDAKSGNVNRGIIVTHIQLIHSTRPNVTVKILH